MDVKKWLFAGSVLFCSVLLVACEYFDQTNEVKKVKETPVVQEKTEVKDPVVEEQKPEAEKPKAPKEAERVKLGETIGNDQIEVPSAGPRKYHQRLRIFFLFPPL